MIPRLKRISAAALAAMMLFTLLPGIALADGDAPAGEPAVTGEEVSPGPEVTADPAQTPDVLPEVTEAPAPEITATPTPETTATPVPEVTAVPTPEVTEGPDGAPASDAAAEPALIGDNVPMPIVSSGVTQVQTMIDRLPDEVTWENYEEVRAQLDEIFTALNDLSIDDRLAVNNIEKYKSTKKKIESKDTSSFSGSGGAGTADSPYLIQTEADLKMFRIYINFNERISVSKYFKLDSDIDLSGKAWTPIGKNPAYAFSGTFDGDGHTISGINGIEYAGDYAGLFGWNSGTVKNLTVEGAISASVNELGGIVGYNTGTIENCTSAVSVSAGTNYIGGIAGRNIDGTIQNCTNTGSISGGTCTGGIAGYSNGVVIKCSNTGSVNGSSQVATYTGGIAGWNYNTVRSCSNTGTVSGGERTGGIVGWNFNAVNNCWNTGRVNSNEYAGGIVGWNEGYCTVKSCWNTGDTIGAEITGGIIAAISAYGWSGENSYYLDTAQGAGGPGEKRTAEQFASGEVAWLLQNGQEDGAQVWGQQLPTEPYPLLTGEPSKRVFQVTFQTDDNPTFAVEYANSGGKVAPPGDPPPKEGCTFYGWSTAQGAEGKVFDDSTAVTQDMTVYAVDWEAFTGESGDIPCQAVHGTAGTLDLSPYVHYESDASTAGKFAYEITDGNDTLTAAMDGDTLTVPAAADVGEYTLAVTVKDKQADNPLMQDAQPVTLTVKVTVTPAELSLTIPGITITYGDVLTDNLLGGGTAKIKDTDITVEGAWTWAVQGVVPTVPDSGVTAYKVMFTPTADKAENFVEASRSSSITVIVKKAESSGAVTGKADLVCTGRPQELAEAAEPAVGGQFQYSTSEEGPYSPAVPTGTDVGTYTFWYKVAGDENHNDTAPQQITVTIAKGEGRGTVAMADYTCMDNSVEPVVTSDTNGTENVTYSYKERDAADDAYRSEKPLAAGAYTVRAELPGNDNFYTLTLTADFKITHQFNAGWEQQTDGYRHDCPCGTGLLLEVDALTQVPEGLKDIPEVDTVEKIERIFEQQLDTGEDYALYDVRLETLVDDEWVEVSPENFPAEGVTITVPYPAGTDAGYTFTVIHMITTGADAGRTETLAVTKGDSGLTFTVKSLSPIAIGWTAPAIPATPAPTAAATAPDTGDAARPGLWLAVTALSLAGLALIKKRRLRGRG